MVIHTKVAERLFTFDKNLRSQQPSRLFKVFKIKAKSIKSKDNHLSDSSLVKICQTSKESMEELSIRNGERLSKASLIENIKVLKNL